MNAVAIVITELRSSMRPLPIGSDSLAWRRACVGGDQP